MKLIPFALLALPLALHAADPGLVKTEFLFEPNPVPSCHASTIVETAKGLVAAWFAGADEGEKDVGVWMSRQVDGQWTKPQEVANGVQPDGSRHPCWNPVLFQPKGGPLVLFYKVGPNPREWWGVTRLSQDHGQSWGEAKKLADGALGPIKNKPVQLPDGSILSPSSAETPTSPSKWRVHFERAKSLADEWVIVKPSSPGFPALDAIQPSVLFLGGERLMALGRTRQKRMFRVLSEDLGKTWGEMSLLDLPNPNAGTDALTMRDGRHVLIYNHTERGRSPLNVAISRDGQEWQAALVLENEPNAEFSYPAVIQTSDGLLHFTYTWRRKLVKHAVVDPAKLELRPIRGGAWPK